MVEHNRAHRGSKENYLQLKRLYFWPNLKRNIESHTRTCKICFKNKYERHPVLQKMGRAPLPKTIGEMLHIDIFFVDNNKFLTCIDKYSKFMQIFHLRSNTHIPEMIEQILVIYPNCLNVTTDNDASFTSQVVNSIFRTYNINHHTTPSNYSTTNGQVERAHYTILEIARTLAEQQKEPISEIIFQAVRKYNNSIHSVTEQTPSEILYHSEKYPQVYNLLKKAQDQSQTMQNKNRHQKTYQPGDIIYVKTDRRNKATPRFTKHTVKTEKKDTIITTKNKEIHKDNIRR